MKLTKTITIRVSDDDVAILRRLSLYHATTPGGVLRLILASEWALKESKVVELEQARKKIESLPLSKARR